MDVKLFNKFEFKISYKFSLQLYKFIILVLQAYCPSTELKQSLLLHIYNNPNIFL